MAGHAGTGCRARGFAYRTAREHDVLQSAPIVLPSCARVPRSGKPPENREVSLHICDYAGVYDDLTPFLDYSGHVVNCSLTLGERTMSPTDAARMFGRPFMGGLERKGAIATGGLDEIRQAAEGVLAEAPERFILAADCTVPSDTPWEHLKTAIDTAHQYRN